MESSNLDNPCEHNEDWFDMWDDTYEMELPYIRLIRQCPKCGTQEEYTLQPDPSSDFQQQYAEVKRRLSKGEIADIDLQLVPERTDGLDAFAHLTIERGEGTGREVVSDQPYYFYY